MITLLINSSQSQSSTNLSVGGISFKCKFSNIIITFIEKQHFSKSTVSSTEKNNALKNESKGIVFKMVYWIDVMFCNSKVKLMM